MSKIVYVENNEMPQNLFLKNPRNKIIILIISLILTLGAVGSFVNGLIDGYNEVDVSIKK